MSVQELKAEIDQLKTKVGDLEAKEEARKAKEAAEKAQAFEHAKKMARANDVAWSQANAARMSSMAASHSKYFNKPTAMKKF